MIRGVANRATLMTIPVAVLMTLLITTPPPLNSAASSFIYQLCPIRCRIRQPSHVLPGSRHQGFSEAWPRSLPLKGKLGPDLPLKDPSARSECKPLIIRTRDACWSCCYTTHLPVRAPSIDRQMDKCLVYTYIMYIYT